jgi:hypothetical protein
MWKMCTEMGNFLVRCKFESDYYVKSRNKVTRLNRLAKLATKQIRKQENSI